MSKKREQEQALLEEAMLAAQEAMAEAERRKEEVLSNIAASVEAKLNTRMGMRKAKEAQWLEAMKLYLGPLASNGAITEQSLFFSAQATSRRPEHNIVQNKCKIAIEQTCAYQFASGDKNWSIRAPKVVEIDEVDVQQFAQAGQPPPQSPMQIAEFRAGLMEKEIEYHLTNSRYGAECRKAIEYMVILGTGILKGPDNAGKMKKVYRRVQNSEGKFVRIPEITTEKVPHVYAVNPWYFFPDDSVAEFKHCEDTIEVHPKSKSELRELLKHKGFDADAIAKVLAEPPMMLTNSPFSDPAYLTQGLSMLKDKYLVAEYHGPITKDDLGTLGVDTVLESDVDALYCEVWVVNGRVIRFDLSNMDGCYKLPYYMSVWEPDPATPFGFGIPMLVRDQQRVVNEAYKMALDNAGVSAGPQVVVDTTLIKPAEGGLECTPFKVWYADEAFGADLSKAIQFFVPPNQFEGLNQLIQIAKGFSEEESSIPAIMSGIQNPTGAADSATGLAIINQNAQSPIFYKAEQWDDDITAPLITAMYEWEMEYNPKDEIKGAYDIDVRTSTSYLRNKMDQQKLERLSMEISQGSPIGEYVNLDAMVMARLMGMDLPTRDMVKSPEQVKQERANKPPPPPDPNMIKAQAEMEKVANDKQRIAMEMRKLDIEANQKAEEARMKFQAQMATDETRKIEAQASVMKAQFDFQSNMAQLAAKSEADRAKILADLQKSAIEDQSKRFLAGMELPLKVEEQRLKEEELKVKRKQGSGI